MSELFKVSMKILNWPDFSQGLTEAQKLQLRYGRSEMKRGAQRIRKAFINQQLKGPPGIKAGKLAQGKNIWTFVKGDNPDNIEGKIGISRILHTHEKGITIQPTKGKYLFIHKHGRHSPIVAVVTQVKIPKRLDFTGLVAREAPMELAKVAQAQARGVEVALKNSLKRTVSAL